MAFVTYVSISPPDAKAPQFCSLTDNIQAGFVRRVQGIADGNGWDHVYDLSYFFGFFVSGTIHWALHMALPAERQTGSSPFIMELHRTRSNVQGETVQGYVASTKSYEDENVVVGKEKTTEV